MPKLLLIVILCVLHIAASAANDEEKLYLQVLDPYIEVHSGPGRGYPVFYVVSRDEWVEVLHRRTDWFKVRTPDEKEGWVSVSDMVMTLTPAGARTDITDPGEEDFRVRNWEYGVVGGDFEGASAISFYAAWHFTENISTEVSLSQVLGTASSSTLLGGHLVHQPFPEWPVSPFFSLGTGIIETRPKATLSQTQDRRDWYSHVGIGARMHLTKRFLLRFEYRSYVIFAGRNDNEEIDEWKAGFGFFF